MIVNPDIVAPPDRVRFKFTCSQVRDLSYMLRSFIGFNYKRLPHSHQRAHRLLCVTFYPFILKLNRVGAKWYTGKKSVVIKQIDGEGLLMLNELNYLDYIGLDRNNTPYPALLLLLTMELGKYYGSIDYYRE
ncbi:MAG: hypothetical protein F9K23_15870 [Bacteroidetes bacterium]|nr:MAG: hypothetical protein F9K23_15870 [Bacteroidota bacterium]